MKIEKYDKRDRTITFIDLETATNEINDSRMEKDLENGFGIFTELYIYSKVEGGN